MESIRWCEKNISDFKDLIQNEDDIRIFKESKKFYNNLKNISREKIKSLSYKMGGGGNYLLLYFLIRKYKPKIILETGVALGFSSKAILEAIEVNKEGKLFSSDYPYLNAKNGKQNIGLLVDKHLRQNWMLFLDGDSKNIKNIKQLITSIDLFHYDSDKSVLGRQFTILSLKELLHANSIIVMDDIQDNLFFKNFTEKYCCQFYVFEFEKKYCGIIKNLEFKSK